MDPPQKPKLNPAPPRQPGAGPARPAPTEGVARPSRPANPPEATPSGRVRHDERGNAVWDWIKDTGRHALESTSRLLKKLEVPQMKTEDKEDEELRLESDREPGGGYDPYNQSTKPRPGPGPPRKGR